ncbi:FAD-dependent monooxygenase [Spirillospora sp. NPDC048911]|uniref:FAD-dependent monooxygenase n=1 Tax=Spirillospora sp. NPDC048911 TaxID=3364527 RepID=UPI00371F130E
MTTRELDADVVIVGAGPVGLMLAVELRLSRARVVVVDQPAVPRPESRAVQLNTRTAEILHARWMDDLLDEAEPEPEAHFGGLTLDLATLDSPYAGNWKVPRYRIEAALARRARDLGAVLLRSYRVHDLTETSQEIHCGVEGPAGRRTLRAEYVVGCDGDDSDVRRLGGFAFPATAATKEILCADVTGLRIRDRRFERRERGLAVAATHRDVTRVMVHALGRPPVRRDRPPAFAEIAGVWARVTGEDIFGAHPIWTGAFSDVRGQATQYRRGRILLAGGAAHRHPPIGGQSINVGLQDAVNLGWRLAGHVRGWAGTGLLDGYHAERHPVGARVLQAGAAQETLLLGGPEVTPLRTVLAELLIHEPVRAHLAGLAGGLDVRYGAGRHPLVGRRMPAVGLRTASGTVSTARTGADGRGLLLTLPGSPIGLAETDALASAWASRLHVVHAARPPEASALDGLHTVLLRPDGHVAWVNGEATGLADALRRWFGTPSPARPRQLQKGRSS